MNQSLLRTATALAAVLSAAHTQRCKPTVVALVAART